MQIKEEIELLYPKIRDSIVETPLEHNQMLSDVTGCNIYLKLENLQTTGSFKLRGVASKFHQLSTIDIPKKHVATASTGNHAAGVAHVSELYGYRATIFVPTSITASKKKKLEKEHIDLILAGEQSGETELIAMDWAKKNNVVFVHPYNDPEVIKGQGTIGYEIANQLKDVHHVVIPVGGGGLISGIAAYLKAYNPSIHITGVQPVNAAEMAESIVQGRVVDPFLQETLSDGTAGGLDPDTITLSYCQKYVDHFIRVSEGEILRSFKLLYQATSMKVEPAAALSLAGILKEKDQFKNQNCVSIICGGNISSQRFDTIYNIS